jgi:hypothetical protein
VAIAAPRRVASAGGAQRRAPWPLAARLGALTGIFNWQRATPLLAPKVGEYVELGALPKLDPDRLRLRMPHLLIWGVDDKALPPVAWGKPAGRLRRPRHPQAGRRRPLAGAPEADEVTRLIDDFLRG